MVGNDLIVLHVLPPRLTEVAYLDLLNNNLGLLFEQAPLHTRRDLWYFQDGAPDHDGQEVRRCFNRNCLNKWIGRYGTVFSRLVPPISIHVTFSVGSHETADVSNSCKHRAKINKPNSRLI